MSREVQSSGQDAPGTPVVDRRKFLSRAGAAVAALGTLSLDSLRGRPAQAQVEGSIEIPTGFPESFPEAAVTPEQRREAAFKYRTDVARFWHQSPLPTHRSNGDETRYPNRIGSYSKCLPHDAFGEVDETAFQSLLHAVDESTAAAYDAIEIAGDPASPVGKLVNPQAGLAFDLQGGDCHQFTIPPAPRLDSAEEAGEEVELYWMALLRDVNFNDYRTHPLAQAAIAELNALSDFRGPRRSGRVTPQTLFRDVVPGGLLGPYLSQFMILPTPFGSEFVDRRSRVFAPGEDYMTDYGEWLNIQNGGRPVRANFDPVRRYMRNGRDLARWVNIDVLFQAYFNACLILLTPPDADDPLSGGIGCPLNSGNPYRNSSNQFGFGTFGPPGIKALMCEVASRALKAVWFQKWQVHRRLRPEAYAGLVHHQKTSNRYPGILHPDVLDSEAVERVHDQYGTYLLPMAFPEGSPTHPAYGAGHATVAGACTTILKALFDEDFVIPNPMVVSGDGLSLEPYGGPGRPVLTVRGELNKLASNVATGRNIAGVHWRTDAFWSLRLGEAVAISILRDQRGAFSEVFNGYTFTGFDGRRITV